MSSSFAPRHLPVPPRPTPDEVIASWMRRVAAANGVSLDDLLDGFESRYPRALRGLGLLDWALPRSALKGLARFGRVRHEALQVLDLERRAPHLDPRLLLRFPEFSPSSLRRHWLRVRYASLPRVLGRQVVGHSRAD